jgi:serine/threonine protein kinase
MAVVGTSAVPSRALLSRFQSPTLVMSTGHQITFVNEAAIALLGRDVTGADVSTIVRDAGIRAAHAKYVRDYCAGDPTSTLPSMASHGGGACVRHQITGKGIPVVLHVDRLGSEFIATLTPRAITADDYTFCERIGSGAFATVWRASSKLDGRPTAVKVLRKEGLAKSFDAALVEIRALRAGATSPFVTTLYAIHQSPLEVYLFMELAEGGNLAELLGGTRVTEDAARFYGIESLAALKHMHGAGLIVRDLKLDNLLVRASGHIILCDFGISSFKASSRTLCGTPDYMSPEIVSEDEYDHRTDIWAWGAIISEMLTGRLPWLAADMAHTFVNILAFEFDKLALPPGVSQPCRDLLRRALQVKPETRCTGRQARSSSWMEDVEWEDAAILTRAPPIVPVARSTGTGGAFAKLHQALDTARNGPT